MNFDIGIGRCVEISADLVVVKVDSVILRKLMPQIPWRRTGTSLLRCDRKACSKERPPQIDAELYLDSKALRGSRAFLDLEGDGTFLKVDLSVIADSIDAPSPTGKSR